MASSTTSRHQRQHHRLLKTGSDIITAVKHCHFDKARSLLPAPLDTAFTFGPANRDQRSLPHLANIVSALFEWWQAGRRSCQVRLLSERKRSTEETLPRGACTLKRMRVFWSPIDYICQGNETEQKLSNIKLFKCILHPLSTALCRCSCLEAEI